MINNNNFLISIVTVVYNEKDYLEETIQSVLNQSYKNVEYIIIDGGSNDGTVDIIKKYEDRINYWISESDGGIYDAMNKGINIATGKFVGFINANDLYYPGTLNILAKAIHKYDFDYTFGPVDIIDKNSNILDTAFPIPVASMLKDRLLKIPSPHQSFFIKKDILNIIGSFDIKYKLRADYDMMLRVTDYSSKVWVFDKAVAQFREGGASSSLATFFENISLLKRYNVTLGKRYYLFTLSAFKYFLFKILPYGLFKILKTFKNNFFS
jgi:glycosyltransferase involved in cell wall biosynthesis